MIPQSTQMEQGDKNGIRAGGDQIPMASSVSTAMAAPTPQPRRSHPRRPGAFNPRRYGSPLSLNLKRHRIYSRPRDGPKSLRRRPTRSAGCHHKRPQRSNRHFAPWQTEAERVPLLRGSAHNLSANCHPVVHEIMGHISNLRFHALFQLSWIHRRDMDALGFFQKR